MSSAFLNQANAPAKEDYGQQEVRARALTILNNHQLMTKYAMANDVSVPALRLYFEKVAAGANPPALIKNWHEKAV